MPTITAFLNHVLPEQSGGIALGYGDGGPERTDFVKDAADLVRRLPKLFGKDVYYTPARYGTSRRTAAACVAKRCVVIDVDLNHPTKPSYSTKEEAIVASFAALAALRWPAPGYVMDSGRGLHLYWPLDRDVEPAAWRSSTEAIKAAWARQDPKLAVDTTRIADLAGYLRMPGSINTKSGTLCAFYELNGVHAGTEKTCALDAFGTAGEAKPFLPPRSAPATSKFDRVGGAAMTSGTAAGPEDTRIPRPLLLKESCAPLAKLAEGDQSYEAWQGLARLFARSDNADEGREAFHDVSRAYKHYSRAETDNKFSDALATSFASPSCAQMRAWAGLPLSACASCPLFQAQGEGGKPAALQIEFIDPMAGQNVVAATEDDEVSLLAEARRARQAESSAPMKALGIKIPRRMFRVPGDGFEGLFIDKETGWFMAQVQVETKSDDGHKITIDEQRLVSRSPFWVESRVLERDPRTGNDVFSARLVQVTRVEEDEWIARYITVPSDEINANAGTLMTACGRYGLDMHAVDARKKEFQLVVKWIRHGMNAINRSRAIRKEGCFGWRNPGTSERSFIIGDRRYNTDGSTVLIEQEPGITDLNDKVQQRGSLAESKKISARAMANGRFPLRLLMLSALGAPLLHMTNVEGALVLVSGKTGKGKTAALSYANSFYGSSRPGKLTATGVDTQKSIMHLIGALANLPAFIDETTSMSDEAMAATLLQITQGGENNRMEGSSNRLRQRNRWQTIAIASANKSVTEIIHGESFTGEAQRVRAIDLKTGDETGEIFYTPGSRRFLSDVLQPSHHHHGMLGVAFIKFVLKNYDLVQTMVQQFDAKIRDGATILAARNGDMFRVWRAVAAVCCATAMIGAQLEFWTMSKSFLDEIVSRLTEQAEDLQRRSDIDPSTYIRDFLSVNQGAITIDAVQRQDGTVVDGRDIPPPGAERVMSIDGKRAPSHVPARASVARLTLVEGATDAVCDISRISFRRFCRDNHLDIDYIIMRLHDAGMLIDSDAFAQISKDVPLPSLPTTVSTVGGEALPAVKSLVVKLRLTRPYNLGYPPEYL